MTRVLCVGVAVIDMVMNLAEMPSKPEKYRARDAALVGGGCAATAAVAVARLGGRALLAGRLGQDAIGELIVGELESEGVDCTLLRRFSGRGSRRPCAAAKRATISSRSRAGSTIASITSSLARRSMMR